MKTEGRASDAVVGVMTEPQLTQQYRCSMKRWGKTRKDAFLHKWDYI